MSRARVLILSFSHIDRDPRVLRQVALLAADHDVITCGYGPAPARASDHIQIPDELTSWRQDPVRLGALLALRRHRRLYFGSKRVRTVLAEAARRGPLDVVLANDAIGVPAALAMRPRRGVHADLHEYAPRQGETRQWRTLVAPLMRWSAAHLRDVASATTVSDGIAAEYARHFGIHPAIVPNATRYRPDLRPTPTRHPIRLVHAGVAGRGRHLELMVDAVKAVNAASPGRYLLDLYLVPGDQRYITELTARAGDSAVTGVSLPAPVPFQELVPTMHRYDVGIFVCPPTTFNLQHTLPNKFFEFVQARLGIVVGPTPEMAELVRAHGLGVVTADFTAAATAEALRALTPERVDGYKAAAHAAAPELSAERLSAPWLDAITRLARG